MSKETRIEAIWRERAWPARLLWPLSVLFAGLSTSRRLAYRFGLFQSFDPPVPVVVVGNLSVGGSGKTPLVQAVAEQLSLKGWRPGIVSRGHGSNAAAKPKLVSADDSALEVGDEVRWHVRHGRFPVCVGRDRAAAVCHLAEHSEVDLVVTDDGLQHYRMGRTVELVAIDGARGLGNGWRLPAGPLREGVSRLKGADGLAIRKEGELDPALLAVLAALPTARGSFTLKPLRFRELGGGRIESIDHFRGQRVQALAAIAHPVSFFRTLQTLGIEPVEHPMPDHAPLDLHSEQFDAALPLVMTAKDAARLDDKMIDRFRHEGRQGWVLDVEAELDEPLRALIEVLSRKCMQYRESVLS